MEVVTGSLHLFRSVALLGDPYANATRILICDGVVQTYGPSLLALLCGPQHQKKSAPVRGTVRMKRRLGRPAPQQLAAQKVICSRKW